MPRILDIAHVHGIAIRVHVSAVVAFVLLVFILAGVYFPAMLPSQVTLVYWSVAFISTLFHRPSPNLN